MEGYGASAFFSCSPPSDSSVHASWRNGAFGTALGSNAEVDLGSSNSFLLLGLAAGGFGQALQRNQPVEDVCVRAIWRPAVPRGPAWRRRVSGSPQATTRAAASTCLVIYRDRQPTSAAAARPTQTTEVRRKRPGLGNSYLGCRRCSPVPGILPLRFDLSPGLRGRFRLRPRGAH